MIINKIPCDKDCPDRSAKCHAKCEKYARYAAEREEYRQGRHKEKDEYDAVLSHIYRTAARRKKNGR